MERMRPFQASPSRIDEAMEMRSQSSSIMGVEHVHNFAEVIQADQNAVIIAGNRISGIRVT